MFELDEWGELLWIPLALLTGALVLRWRGPLLGGTARGVGLASLGQAGALAQVGSRAAAMMRAMRGQAGGEPSSGNQSYDAHERDALRRIDDDRDAFKQHRDHADRTREKAEFDAFVAERNKSRS